MISGIPGEDMPKAVSVLPQMTDGLRLDCYQGIDIRVQVLSEELASMYCNIVSGLLGALFHLFLLKR
jgi:hypothetical protein